MPDFSQLPGEIMLTSKNAVICGIEHALRGDGCNEILVTELFASVNKTRGNLALALLEFMAILEELEKDGLFEFFGPSKELIARSQTHPSVPCGDALQL